MIPVIDLSSATAAEQLVDAFESIGFATIVGHGIDPSLITKAMAASRQFFQLDAETKRKYGYRGHESNRGYIALGNESHQDFRATDRKEAFDIGKEGEPGCETPWPTELADSSFQADLLAYMDAFDALQLRLMRLIAQGLGLEDLNFFSDRCNDRHVNLRLLHYPSLPKPPGNDVVIRGARHTDFGTLTLLTQDDTGGLRVQRLDGTWTMVPPPADENGIVINVGEMLERWTNGRLQATPHQVIEPESLTSEDIPERYSIAFFCNANKNVTLEPLATENEASKYEPVNAHEYLTGRLAATIAKS